MELAAPKWLTAIATSPSQYDFSLAFVLAPEVRFDVCLVLDGIGRPYDDIVTFLPSGSRYFGLGQV
jgi:hypothetical protein